MMDYENKIGFYWMFYGGSFLGMYELEAMDMIEKIV